MSTCPVIGVLFGIQIPCENEAAIRLTVSCDGGHPLRNIDVCGRHEGIAMGDLDQAMCRLCDDEGSPASRIHLVATAPLPSSPCMDPRHQLGALACIACEPPVLTPVTHRLP